MRYAKNSLCHVLISPLSCIHLHLPHQQLSDNHTILICLLKYFFRFRPHNEAPELRFLYPSPPPHFVHDPQTFINSLATQLDVCAFFVTRLRAIMYVSFKNNWLVWFEIHSFSAPILLLVVISLSARVLLKKCFWGWKKKWKAKKLWRRREESDGEYFIWPGIGSGMMSKGSRDPAFRMIEWWMAWSWAAHDIINPQPRLSQHTQNKLCKPQERRIICRQIQLSF